MQDMECPQAAPALHFAADVAMVTHTHTHTHSTAQQCYKAAVSTVIGMGPSQCNSQRSRRPWVKAEASAAIGKPAAHNSRVPVPCCAAQPWAEGAAHTTPRWQHSTPPHNQVHGVASCGASRALPLMRAAPCLHQGTLHSAGAAGKLCSWCNQRSPAPCAAHRQPAGGSHRRS